MRYLRGKLKTYVLQGARHLVVYWCPLSGKELGPSLSLHSQPAVVNVLRDIHRQQDPDEFKDKRITPKLRFEKIQVVPDLLEE